MRIRIHWLLLVALLLTACGSAPPSALLPTAAPGRTATAIPAQPTAPPPTDLPVAPASTVAPTAAPATVAPPTAAPTLAATAVPPPPSAEPATAALAATAVPALATAGPATAAPAEAAAGSQLLFLRAGALWAHALNGGAERKIAADVREFALSSDGATLALVLGREQTDIYLASLTVPGAPRQLTNDPRSESGLGWSLYGALVFASSGAPLPALRDEVSWGPWCAQSEVRIIEEETPNARLIAPGCDPAFSPDGKRIAFATPPQQSTATDVRYNSIRLVNAAGKNGWDFAKATGEDAGQVVHGPSWSPDGAQVSYHRFVGYRALVDIALNELGASFQGKGKPYAVGGRLAPGPPASPPMARGSR